MNKSDFLEDYFVRKEYLLELQNSYIDCDKYFDFTRTLYKTIELKNRIIQYCILKNKYGKHLDNIIESFFDYSYIDASNYITNHYLIEEKELDISFNTAYYDCKKHILIKNK